MPDEQPKKNKKPDANQLTTEISSDLDGLYKLFEANQAVAHAIRAETDAKNVRKAAEAHRDTLMTHLDWYTIDRRQQVARRGALQETLESMPPWLSNARDPDGRGDHDDKGDVGGDGAK